MKKLILLLVFAVAAFAQRGGHAPAAPHFNVPAQHYSTPQHYAPAAQGWHRFGEPSGAVRFPVRPPVVIVRPGFGFYGGFGWNYYFGLGFWPYYYPYPYDIYGTGVVVPAYQAQPCKKETLKDSNGQKHQVLVCVQSDGSMKVVADADMIAVPKDEVNK